MIIDDDGVVCTPTQIAKRMIESAAGIPVNNEDLDMLDQDKLTQRERALVEAAVLKQFWRVRRFLGFG